VDTKRGILAHSKAYPSATGVFDCKRSGNPRFEPVLANLVVDENHPSLGRYLVACANFDITAAKLVFKRDALKSRRP